jgi:hypothetical protein
MVSGKVTNLGAGGVFGLIAISVVSDLVGGIAEALDKYLLSLSLILQRYLP